MARASKAKKGKAVALQDSPSSEEEQDEDSPQGNRGASHLRIAENMLNAVGFIFQFQFCSFVNQVMTCVQSRKRREAKRKAIETEHKQRVEKARAKIESFYEDRKAKL
jgi:cell division protein FtsB